MEALFVSLFLANVLFAHLWRAAPWAKLRSLLQAGTRLDRLPDVDALA